MTTEIFRWNAALQSTYATFGDWVAAQSDPISLAVGKDIDLGGATVNVPNNIDFVEFYNGAQIKNGTITINRMSAMPLYQIFDSTITIIFGTGAIKEQYIEWYGGKPSVDKSYESANDAAIAKAISIPAPIKLLPATYWFSMPIVFNGVNSNYSLRGTDGYTVIRSTVSNNYIINIMACQRIDIGDFELNGSNVYAGLY